MHGRKIQNGEAKCWKSKIEEYDYFASQTKHYFLVTYVTTIAYFSYHAADLLLILYFFFFTAAVHERYAWSNYSKKTLQKKGCMKNTCSKNGRICIMYAVEWYTNIFFNTTKLRNSGTSYMKICTITFMLCSNSILSSKCSFWSSVSERFIQSFQRIFVMVGSIKIGHWTSGTIL